MVGRTCESGVGSREIARRNGDFEVVGKLLVSL